ncbi:MAG TPA: 1-acyl-sn-glycerol-3-phosphate acyltransferase [Myxococcaceae bacterium]|nr:1-acyl-sn-glycerol-3-phosphate acyltransferase [Myxococcaceae bacterium]
MATALVKVDDSEAALRHEFGPVGRALGRRYCPHVRVAPAAEAELRRLSAEGFVVHVQRTAAWVSFLYLAWLLVSRSLPPIRAVVNMRRWLGRPWRRVAQRGPLDVRFTFARRKGGSALVFLQTTAIGRAGGRSGREDPFPALVTMARKCEQPVFLVPELVVWEKWSVRLKPAWADYVFGTPEAPGFLHSVLAFWRNHRRAQFRVGEAIDLRAFAAQNPDDSDAVVARKVRAVLHVHLARETRAVFGPPYKPPERVIEETLRDRTLRQTIEQTATRSGKDPASLEREARRHLNAIAARLHPTVVALLAPVLGWIFDRIYDGIAVDEAGLERALQVARAGAPIVLCPSHKSHIDYLVMSWVLWKRGYQMPVVAAGANLSFFPLGPLLRRAGAFFLRRSFGADRLYTATFKAYVKKLVRDGVLQEFFPEGGRSRTGKLLPAKLGLLGWEVDAVLEGARSDLAFVPVAIDYEKIVEGSSYSKELLGGEKKPEDVGALILAPKILLRRYGTIHLRFDEPVLLREFMQGRGLSDPAALTEEEKRGLVRALGHRIMWGIARVSTVTPHALVSTALLAHPGRGLPASVLGARVEALRRMLLEDGATLSTGLGDAPTDTTVAGPVREAVLGFIEDKLIRTEQAKGETVYLPVDERRVQLAYYKNTILNLVAPRALVACAVLRGVLDSSLESVRTKALFLSRLFKLEFIYRVGAPFEIIFAETVDRLVGAGLLDSKGGTLVPRDAQARTELGFLADVIRDYLQSYLLAGLALEDLATGPMDRRSFVRAALETGRMEFLQGRIDATEALSRTTLENALAWLLEQEMVAERERRLVLGSAAERPEQREAFRGELRSYLGR